MIRLMEIMYFTGFLPIRVIILGGKGFIIAVQGIFSTFQSHSFFIGKKIVVLLIQPYMRKMGYTICL